MFMYFRVDHWLPVKRSEDVTQAGGGQVQAALPVRKGSNDTGATPDFFHDAFERVVGPDLQPVAVGEAVVAQRLFDMRFDEISGFTKLLATQRPRRRWRPSPAPRPGSPRRESPSACG